MVTWEDFEAKKQEVERRFKELRDSIDILPTTTLQRDVKSQLNKALTRMGRGYQLEIDHKNGKEADPARAIKDMDAAMDMLDSAFAGIENPPKTELKPKTAPSQWRIDESTWAEGDIKYLQKNIEAAEKGILKDFPILREHVPRIVPSNLLTRAWAEYLPSTREIKFSTEKGRKVTWQEIMSRNRENVAGGEDIVLRGKVIRQNVPFHSGDVETNVLTHEFGHAIVEHHKLLSDFSGGEKQFWNAFREKYGDKFGKFDKKGHVTADFLAKNAPSRYGRTSPDEIIAESFADYYTSKTPSEFSRAIVETYKDLYNASNLNSPRAVPLLDVSIKRKAEIIDNFGADTIRKYLRGDESAETMKLAKFLGVDIPDAPAKAAEPPKPAPTPTPAPAPPEPPKPTPKPAPKITGTEKQVAWAEKIIHAKRLAIRNAREGRKTGMTPEEWDAAVARITDASTWIELKDIPAESIARVAAIDTMPAIEAKSDNQRAFAENKRIVKIAQVDAAVKKNVENRESYVQALIREMGKETSAREWIDKPLREMLVTASKAAKAARTAETPKVEPNWANMSAKEIATKYADEMAQIVISAGENITAGIFEDAGAEFAANAAARNAGNLLRRRATQWTANHAQDIAETLAQAAETSASPHSVVEELSREYVEHAETVARTELARVREEANLDIMRAQGTEKVQFVASEDERLCPICGAHHGKVYDVRDAPVLPLHPNCRCTLVPYIDDDGGDR